MKNDFFAFSIKLFRLGGGFWNRNGVEMGYRVLKKLVLSIKRTQKKIPQVPSSDCYGHRPYPLKFCIRQAHPSPPFFPAFWWNTRDSPVGSERIRMTANYPTVTTRLLSGHQEWWVLVNKSLLCRQLDCSRPRERCRLAGWSMFGCRMLLPK